LLLGEIAEQELKKTEFAGQPGILPGNLTELFKGKRHINARLAVNWKKF